MRLGLSFKCHEPDSGVNWYNIRVYHNDVALEAATTADRVFLDNAFSRISVMAKKVLGDDFIRLKNESMRSACLELGVKAGTASGRPFKALKGWIELFCLEQPPSPRQPADHSVFGGGQGTQ